MKLNIIILLITISIFSFKMSQPNEEDVKGKCIEWRTKAHCSKYSKIKFCKEHGKKEECTKSKVWKTCKEHKNHKKCIKRKMEKKCKYFL
jgi:hypothetical protein